MTPIIAVMAALGLAACTGLTIALCHVAQALDDHREAVTAHTQLLRRHALAWSAAEEED